MCLAIRKVILISLFVGSTILFSQSKKTNQNAIEIGLIGAGDESLYYGGYGKYIMPLSQRKHYFMLGLSLATYFDFKGESEKQAYLKNDLDMRLIPAVNIGYSLNFKKVQLNFEVPIGVSIAITKGTLVNEKISFERDFSNKEVFFNYGFSFSPKYKINSSNSIGLYGFMPLINDKAQSGYQFGIGWTKTFRNN